MGILYVVKPDKNHYKNLNCSTNIYNILYKVGLSKKERLDRLKDYGKGAIWIRAELVKDAKYLEKIMINKMKEKCGNPFYGREYFLCKNYEDIKEIFSEVIKLDREPLNKELIPCDNLYNKKLIIKFFNMWKKIDKKINIVLSPNTERWIKVLAGNNLYKGSRWYNKLNNVYVNDKFYTTLIFNKRKTRFELRFKNGFNVPAMKINNNWYDLDIYIMLSRICPRIKNKMLNSVCIWWDKVIKDGGFTIEDYFIEWNHLRLEHNVLFILEYYAGGTSFINLLKKIDKKCFYSKDWIYLCYYEQSYNRYRYSRMFDNNSFWREIKKNCIGDLYVEKKISRQKKLDSYVILPTLEDARNRWKKIQNSYTYDDFIKNNGI